MKQVKSWTRDRHFATTYENPRPLLRDAIECSIFTGSVKGNLGERTIASVRSANGDWDYILAERQPDVSLKTDIEPRIERLFNELVTIWRDATGMMSQFKIREKHWAYQMILRLGREFKESIIPLLLQNLEDDPFVWMITLETLTGAKPIRSEDKGNPDKMIQSWIRWGEANGIRF